jgi:hypothetical protein
MLYVTTFGVRVSGMVFTFTFNPQRMKIKRFCLLHLQNINILSFLSVKLVSITTKVVSSSSVNAVVYSMQLLKCDKVWPRYN